MMSPITVESIYPLKTISSAKAIAATSGCSFSICVITSSRYVTNNAPDNDDIVLFVLLVKDVNSAVVYVLDD